jgi:hypothetical protein
MLTTYFSRTLRCGLIACLVPAMPALAQTGAKNGEWRSYGGDTANTRYSPLDQINRSNFNQLEVAWRFKTDNLGTRPEYKLEGTPLAINGVLYTTGGTRRSVVALDGKTGELLWAHSLREGKRAGVSPRQLSGRGLSYWTDGRGDDRILYVTTGYRLVALNALLEINCALLIDRLAGLRSLEAFTSSSEAPAGSPEYFGSAYSDADGTHWQEINLQALSQQPQFLSISA